MLSNFNCYVHRSSEVLNLKTKTAIHFHVQSAWWRFKASKFAFNHNEQPSSHAEFKSSEQPTIYVNNSATTKNNTTTTTGGYNVLLRFYFTPPSALFASPLNKSTLHQVLQQFLHSHKNINILPFVCLTTILLTPLFSLPSYLPNILTSSMYNCTPSHI